MFCQTKIYSAIYAGKGGYLCIQSFIRVTSFNSLPNNKILDKSELKGFADDKIILTEKLKYVLGRVENIVGNGANAGYQHFLSFPTMFSKAFFSRGVKSWDGVVKS